MWADTPCEEGTPAYNKHTMGGVAYHVPKMHLKNGNNQSLRLRSR